MLLCHHFWMALFFLSKSRNPASVYLKRGFNLAHRQKKIMEADQCCTTNCFVLVPSSVATRMR